MARKKKKNPKNPYDLRYIEDGEQRIGSLVDQGVSIKVRVNTTRTKTNTSS